MSRKISQQRLEYDKDLTDVIPHYLEKRYQWTDTDYGSNFDYWLEDSTSDEIVSMNTTSKSPNQKSLEAVEDHSLGNWVSNDEESLCKVHPEVIPNHHSDSWSERVNTESDIDKIPSPNHLSHSTNSSHKDLNDITVDNSTVDNSVLVPNLVTLETEVQPNSDNLYPVVLPFTNISRYFGGAGVGLSIHAGVASSSGLVACVTDVDVEGPAFVIGNITTGQIVHEWNGVSLMNKTFEGMKGILNQKITNNELKLILSDKRSDIDIAIRKKQERQEDELNSTFKEDDEIVVSPNPERFKRSRRKSVICFSNDQQQWVFEEQEHNTNEHITAPPIVPRDNKLENSTNYGSVQLSITYSESGKLEVTLHQAKLTGSVLTNPLANITIIGEDISPSGLCDGEMSLSLMQTNHPVWNQKLDPFKLSQNSLATAGLHVIIWDYKSDEQYSFVGEVFLNLSSSTNSVAAWYPLTDHDHNLPQLATPVGVKKRAIINRLFDRVLSATSSLKPNSNKLNLPDLTTTRRRTFPEESKKKGSKDKKNKSNKKMLVMRPKLSYVKEDTAQDTKTPPTSCCQQAQYSSSGSMDQQETPFNTYSTNGRTMEVEAVTEPHAYQPAWGLDTKVHKKPIPEQDGFEVKQEKLGSPSSGYTSMHHSETSSTNRNSGFSNYSNSSTESPGVLWHEESQNMGSKYSTMVRRSCSLSNLHMDNTIERQALQGQSRKHSQESANSDKLMNDYPRLKPCHRSASVEILLETDSSTECSQCGTPLNSSQEDNRALASKPENLIMSFKMKYSAVPQPPAPNKSRMFFIKAKKIKAPFKLFRHKQPSETRQMSPSEAARPSKTSVSSISSSPEGSKISLSQQRKELGIGQFIPKLDHLQEPCGRMRFSLVQHRRLLLKIRTIEERSPTLSGNDCTIKATLVQGKEVICKKKVSTVLSSAANPLAEMYLDSQGCTDRMHLHIMVTKGSLLSKKYVGEVWVNLKWADLSGLSSWYQLYT